MAIIGECLLKTKILAAFLLMAPLSGMAQHHHHGMRHFDHHQAHRGGWDWVAPAVIGGALAYGLTRPTIVQPQPVYVQPPLYVQPHPVYIQSHPVYIQQSPMVGPLQVVTIDGVSYVKKTMIINDVVQEVLVRQ